MDTELPKWASAILCDPQTLDPLLWTASEAQAASGAKYAIREGIPVFHNELSSYQNRTIARPTVDRHNPTIHAFEDRHTIFDVNAATLRDRIVVDVCAGGGMPSYYLAAHYNCQVISVERAFNAIKYYGDCFRDYYQISDDQVVRLCADVKQLPIKSESVDAVLGSSWVHHFEDKVDVLRGAYRTLKPGGILIAHNEGIKGLASPGTSDEDRYTSAAAYRKAMQAAGFVDIAVTPASRWYHLLGWLKGSVDIIGTRPK